jgi:hypothetical protein
MLAGFARLFAFNILPQGFVQDSLDMPAFIGGHPAQAFQYVRGKLRGKLDLFVRYHVERHGYFPFCQYYLRHHDSSR